MFWRWATVVGLSMTPALVLGQSAAAAAGIAWHLDPWVLVLVMAVSGFVEGLLVAYLGGSSTRIGFVRRFCDRMRTPRATAFARDRGRWIALTLGVAVLGQEPMLVSLRWLGIELRRLVVPLAVSNVAFAIIYYEIVKHGIDRVLTSMP